MSTQEILLDATDAAKVLLWSARRIRALARAGQIRHVVLPDGEIRFEQADLAAFIEAHRRPVAEAEGGTQ